MDAKIFPITINAPLDNSKHRRLRQYSIASKVYALLVIHYPIKVSFSSLPFLLAKCDVMERERWPIPARRKGHQALVDERFERPRSGGIIVMKTNLDLDANSMFSRAKLRDAVCADTEEDQ